MLLWSASLAGLSSMQSQKKAKPEMWRWVILTPIMVCRCRSTRTFELVGLSEAAFSSGGGIWWESPTVLTTIHVIRGTFLFSACCCSPEGGNLLCVAMRVLLHDRRKCLS